VTSARRTTDNSHFGAKIRLRVEAVDRTKKKNLYVLDAYSGYGHMWKEVQRQRPEVKIRTLGIDQRKIGPEVIKGDNLKVLPSLDLAGFDLIDLDAYGVPVQQLKIVADKAPKVPVLVTAISARHGAAPFLLYDALGIPRDWSKESPALIRQMLWDGWENFCYQLGYRRTLRYRFTDSMDKCYQLIW